MKVILLDEPTRGIDVGAKHEIYNVIYALAAQGVAVLFASSDLPEVLGVADRIVVMREGEIAGELLHEQADERQALSLAMPKVSRSCLSKESMMSSVSTSGSGAPKSSFSFGRIWDQYGMLVVFAVLFIACAIFVPNFATFINMKGLGPQFPCRGWWRVACCSALLPVTLTFLSPP